MYKQSIQKNALPHFNKKDSFGYTFLHKTSLFYLFLFNCLIIRRRRES